MNLREKFLWNIALIVSIIIILWNGWTLFNQHQRASRAIKVYQNEDVGTDKKLEDMVKILEKSLKKRQELTFKPKANPLELTRVVSVDGLSSNKGQKGINCNTVWSVQDEYQALCTYREKRYTVAVGDSIAGGIVNFISQKKVIIKKDDETIEFDLGLKQ